MAHVFSQIFTMASNVDSLFIFASHNHPGWEDDTIDRTEWLAFFRSFPIVKTLHVSGGLAGQFARALEDVPGEAVTEVLPSLHRLLFDNDKEWVMKHTEQFASLRQRYGRPVTIVDLEAETWAWLLNR